MQVECQNCDWTGDEDATKPARDIGLRHEVGDIYSGMECPKCGALCHIKAGAKAAES